MALARTQNKVVNVGCWDISHMTVDIGEIPKYSTIGAL